MPRHTEESIRKWLDHVDMELLPWQVELMVSILNGDAYPIHIGRRNGRATVYKLTNAFRSTHDTEEE